MRHAEPTGINRKKIVVLTGAGISQESGIKTFRDDNGLWEGHDVMQVASPQGWQADPQLVLTFYNQRRRQLLQVEPNQGHLALARLAKYFDVSIVTQNVDDLHERAGSEQVIHLHGELLKARSSLDASLVQPWTGDINIGDLCALGSQLRPDIVWFGESVPLLDNAIEEVLSAEIIIIVGTSMKVYPAAGLVSFAPFGTPVYYLDPKPSINEALMEQARLTVIEQSAAIGLPVLVEKLISELTE